MEFFWWFAAGMVFELTWIVIKFGGVRNFVRHYEESNHRRHDERKAD